MVSGPYKITRHPIYTGILIAILGTAIMVGLLRGFIGLAIAFIAFWHKSRYEEDLMNQQFPEQYPVYAQKVKKLIPRVF